MIINSTSETTKSIKVVQNTTPLRKKLTTYIKNEKGEAIFTRKGMNENASESYENLYKVKDGTSYPHSVQGPVALFKNEVYSVSGRESEFLVEEISKVMKELKNNKAPVPILDVTNR